MTPQNSQTERNRSVRRILWRVFALNLLVAAAKLIVGYLSLSLALISDGYHSLLDGLSNIVGLAGSSIAAKPPDRTHPYGHHKFESLAALVIAGLMLLTAWEIVQEVFSRFFREPVQLEPSWLTLLVIGVTLAINIGVTWFEHREGRLLKSPILIADSRHTLSDVFVTLLSLLSVATAFYGLFWIDALAAILIGALIFYSAWRIVRDQIHTLSDAARIDARDIRQVSIGVDGVEDVHAIRSRGTENEIWVDLHIVVPPDISAERTYEIEHEVQDALRRAFPEIVQVYVHHQTHMENNPPAH